MMPQAGPFWFHRALVHFGYESGSLLMIIFNAIVVVFAIKATVDLLNANSSEILY